MRFHVLGLFHTRTSKRYPTCAFTQKVLKLCVMLKGLGHEVIHYGNEGSEALCDEQVNIFTNEEYDSIFGKSDTYYWIDGWETNTKDRAIFDSRCIAAVNTRKKMGDVLIIAWGWNQKTISDAVNIPLTVESGIGYLGVFAPYRVFESYGWMSFINGVQSVKENAGKWWGDWRPQDAVIPNYFDPSDFTFQKDKGDYILFVGRMNVDKGVQDCIDLAARTKTRLILAGPQSGWKYRMNGYSEIIPPVGFEERNRLMGGARAVLTLSAYHEPFGGTTVEAGFCGTPVITTDWAAFSDTVKHGVTGYRCRDLNEMEWSLRNIDTIKPDDCRKWAEEKFSLSVIAPQYDAYFKRIYDGAGSLSSCPVRAFR